MTAGRRVFAPLSREARTFFGPPHPHSVIPADLTGDTGRHVRSGGLKCNAAPIEWAESRVELFWARSS